MTCLFHYSISVAKECTQVKILTFICYINLTAHTLKQSGKQLSDIRNISFSLFVCFSSQKSNQEHLAVRQLFIKRLNYRLFEDSVLCTSKRGAYNKPWSQILLTGVQIGATLWGGTVWASGSNGTHCIHIQVSITRKKIQYVQHSTVHFSDATWWILKHLV